MSDDTTGGEGAAMSEHEQAQAGVLAHCPDCGEAQRRSGAGLIICTCGRVYGHDDARWPRETPAPVTGVRPRPGLDLPPGTVPEPRRPPPRLVRESEEVARVARLLAALRPHGPGPREPLDGPAEGTGGTLFVRTTARAPWDVYVPRGAFVRDDAGAAALAVVQRIARVPDDRTRGVLAWLRRSGTLASGYEALAVGLALAVADEVRRASWAADARHGRDRARAWGAARLDEACAAWDAAGRDGR